MQLLLARRFFDGFYATGIHALRSDVAAVAVATCVWIATSRFLRLSLLFLILSYLESKVAWVKRYVGCFYEQKADRFAVRSSLCNR